MELAVSRSRGALAQDKFRLEALGMMTAGAVHDLGNMIQVFSSAMSILNRHSQIRSTDALQSIVADAMGSLDRATTLIQQILAFMRDDQLVEEPVDVATTFCDMERLLRLICPRAIQFKLELEADLPPLLCCKRKLEDAVLNLVMNARDAMPQGGTITCSVRRAGDIFAPIALLSVTDTGEGMTPEIALCAFEPFFTTKTSSGGNGLGLAMVRRFVQEAGGGASIDSRKGAGTTVTMGLPFRSRCFANAARP